MAHYRTYAYFLEAGPTASGFGYIGLVFFAMTSTMCLAFASIQSTTLLL
jgi:hypothetical protein